jgi:acetyltransferase
VISVLATPLSYTGRTTELITEYGVAILQGHASAAAAIASLYEISRECLPIAERNFAKPQVSVPPGILDEVQASAIFTQYGIVRPREAVVGDPEQAAAAARELDCRVVVKLVCAEVPHKAREGLVKLSLESPDAVRDAAQQVQDRAREMGVDATQLLVQEQLAAGPEFLIGVTVDPLYGPAMTVRSGGGGVSGESAFNLIPLRQGEAMEIAAGAAAEASIDLSDAELKELANVVERFGWLAEDLSDRVLEIEANPIIITGGRAVAVDALAAAKDQTGEN